MKTLIPAVVLCVVLCGCASQEKIDSLEREAARDRKEFMDSYARELGKTPGQLTPEEKATAQRAYTRRNWARLPAN